MKLNKIYLIIASILIATSCVDLDQDPLSFITEEDYIKQEQTIETVSKSLDGLYYDMWYKNYGFNTRIMRLNVAADDINTSPKPNNVLVELAALNPSIGSMNTDARELWANFWKVIISSNKIINGTPIPEKNGELYTQAVAEAYFMRALNYFYMVRIFGDVPIVRTTEEGIEEQDRRAVADVYNEIIVPDLLKAITDLPQASRTGSSITPSKWAAKACLADVYMNMAGWPLKKGAEYYTKAAAEALDIINSSGLSLTPNYADLWKEALKENPNEHMFALHHAAKFKTASNYGKSYYPRDFSPNAGWADYYANPEFMNKYPEDDRKEHNYMTSWLTKGGVVEWPNSMDKLPAISKYYDFDEGPAGKSAQANGLTPIYRYADVLLMYAEASNLATGSVNATALSSLQKVQQRSNSTLTTTTDSQAFDKAVFAERGWEFFAEFKRWFDLVRREKVAEFKTAQYNNSLFKNNNHYYYPIPSEQIEMTGWKNNGGY